MFGEAKFSQLNVRTMQINPGEVVTNFGRTAEQIQKQQASNEREIQFEDIAEAVVSVLKPNDRAFVTDSTVRATNPD